LVLLQPSVLGGPSHSIVTPLIPAPVVESVIVPDILTLLASTTGAFARGSTAMSTNTSAVITLP
jgi:hypothetical protein